MDDDMTTIPPEFWEGMTGDDLLAIVSRGGFLDSKQSRRLWKLLGRNPKRAPKTIGPLFVSEVTIH